jgi:hypothetical protein
MLPRASVLILMTVLLSGCFGVRYGFTGGGLPSHVRTVAIVPFEDASVQGGGVSGEIASHLQQNLPRRLNVRLANERVADAVIRGRIISIMEEAAQVRPLQPGQVATPVIEETLRITLEVEIMDLREDRPLWQNRSLVVTGRWNPTINETRTDGQQRAITDLAERILEGALSQW